MKHILKNWRGLGAVIFILVFGFSTPVYAGYVENNLADVISEEYLTMLTNKERFDNGLPALEQNNLLQRAAELKASDMIKRGYFSHDTPEGRLPWYWLSQAGYKYQAAGENLATNIFEPKELIKAWMSSRGHRANILNEEYTQIGTAVVEGMLGGQETVLVVQFFGTPNTVYSFENFRVAVSDSELKYSKYLVY